MKKLSAVQFDGTTFGMQIEADTKMYKEFKKAIKEEVCINIFGEPMKAKILTVPHLKLAAIMQEAHWLVSEGHYFNKITVEGLRNGEEIFVKYNDEIIDFRSRRREAI